MSKRYNIRWRQDDEEQLRKAVRNYNAKLSRLEKKDPKNKNALPDKISVKQIKSLIETRQDLKREVNALQRFTRRGAEELISVPDNDYNLKITKWQKEEITRRVGVINQRRKRRLENLKQIEMTDRGQKLGYTVGEFGMGKAEEVSLRPLTAFTGKMNQADLKKKFKHVLKESQDNYYSKKEENFRKTFVDTLKRNYHEEDIQDIIDDIEDMDYNDFYAEVQSEGGVKAELEWAYPQKRGSSEYVGNLEKLRSQFKPKK